MHTLNPEGAIRVHLYVRRELPSPTRRCVTAVQQRLADLQSRDLLAAVERTEWDKRVPLAELDDHLGETYLSFVEWADDRDVRLTPFFGTRECYSAGEGGMVDWLVVPAVCLAVHEDDELVGVYPHADGTETRTVEDGLERLRSDLLPVADGTVAPAD